MLRQSGTVQKDGHQKDRYNLVEGSHSCIQQEAIAKRETPANQESRLNVSSFFNSEWKTWPIVSGPRHVDRMKTVVDGKVRPTTPNSRRNVAV